jgi:hypothetical protein
MAERPVRRRALLAAGTAVLGATTALSGCAGGGDGGDDGDGENGGADDDGPDGADGDDADDGTPDDDEATTDGASSTADLDLREANVTGVEVEDRGGGEYRFAVTLYHDVRKSHAIFAAHQKSSDF